MRQRHRWLIGALVVVALAALALIAPGEEGAIARGGIIYVDADAAGADDGTSWMDAYLNLQEALEAAGTGTQIWVAEGTYKPTQLFIEGDLRSAAFQMVNGVGIYGGFAGGEGSLGERDWVNNVTILSGDIGVEGNISDNSYHVFYHPDGTDLDGSAILDGFTITDGNAKYDYPNAFGGGMFNYGSSPTVANCAFEGNLADWDGGGMYNYSSSPVLTNCAFEGNSAYSGGAMLNNYYSYPILANCTFTGNTAVDRGGGMFNNYYSSPTVTNCTFSGNSAPNGGGMYNGYNATATVTNSVLWGDSPEEIANSDLFSSPLVTYSNVQGGYPGDGNIFVSPLFVDAGGGDFHLGPGSPCIDAGSNTAPYLPLYDFEGDDRVLDGDGDEIAIVDMGVDEFHYETPPPPPDVIFVDADAMGANTGTSWTDAYTTLQPALSWAVEGVEIWVAEGIYKPTIGTDRSASFQMKNGVAIYGGFDPTVGDDLWEERDWETNPTILSGDLGLEDYPLDNSYHVFYHPEGTDLDGSAILDGFTICDGNANEEWGTDASGGGMYNYGSSPALANCTFEGNSASFGGGMYNTDGSSPPLTDCTFEGNSGGTGGGMYNHDGSSPTLTNCTFEGNSADIAGGMMNFGNCAPALTNCTFEDNSAGFAGGMQNYNSSPVLSDCTFRSNSASGPVGGLSNMSSSPVLTNCTFDGNSAGNWGGGMSNSDSSPTLINCTFEGNSANSRGGGMSNSDSSPTMTDCTFEGNSAAFGGGLYNGYNSSPALTGCVFDSNSALDSGGGMWNSDGSSPVLTDCTFSGNAADYGGGMNNDASSPVLTNCIFEGNSANAGNGGGMYNWNSSSPALTNCTFYGNLAYVDGGGVFNHLNSSAVLTNCILWENSPNQISNDGSTPTIAYCDVEGGYTGTGNIDRDPLFVDAANGDFHLGEGSPCIDVGSNTAPYLPDYDFEGDDRVLDGDGDGTAIVDMGVDEVVYAGPTAVEIDVRPGSDQNVINLGSGGVVPVAILTTDEFDASTVRPASVRFAGAAPRRWTREDVDRDGDEDLLLNFKIQDLEGLDESSTEATLRGETFPWDGGVPIEGTDTVRIIP